MLVKVCTFLLLLIAVNSVCVTRAAVVDPSVDTLSSKTISKDQLGSDDNPTWHNQAPTKHPTTRRPFGSEDNSSPSGNASPKRRRLSRAIDGGPAPSGQPGSQGQPGPTGEPGSQGQPAPSGQPGSQGQPGPKGQPAPSGQPGPTGEPGPEGPIGAPCRIRPCGRRGEPGPKGLGYDPCCPEHCHIRPPGQPGIPGLPGEPGPIGSPGLPGAPGPIGRPGYTGPRGTPGAPGAPGNTGNDGADGRNGESGPPGRPGLVGVPGHPGAPGNPGIYGPPGPRGQDGPQGPLGPKSGGVTYVRWGRTTCPNITGTELVYRGRAAGSLWSSSGGGANYQCITEEPENFDFTSDNTEVASLLYGAEYEMWSDNDVPGSGSGINQHDVPCVLCYVATRETVVMIPGKYTCPRNWTREYYGWLMAERSHPAHKGRTTFECVDVDAEGVTGAGTSGEASEGASGNWVSFYHVEPRCGPLPCPPYEEQKQMTCVVCTR